MVKYVVQTTRKVLIRNVHPSKEGMCHTQVYLACKERVIVALASMEFVAER
jgi:hypothetical protein